MFKVGDEVLVKGAITDLHEGTDHPYFVAVNYDSVHWVSEEKIIPADKTYSDGLKDAWEKLKERLEEKWNDTVVLADEDDYFLGRSSAFRDALSIVSEVEAEYGNGWIPCSRELPEENGRYITTNMYEGEKEEVFDMWYENGKWFIDAGEDETIRIVLAWMPLPSPYKPTTD